MNWVNFGVLSLSVQGRLLPGQAFEVTTFSCWA